MVKDSKQKKLAVMERVKDLLPFGSVVIIVLLCVTVLGDAFLAKSNLTALLNQLFLTLMGAMGAVFVYGQGELDLSLGSLQALVVLIVFKLVKIDMKYYFLAMILAAVVGIMSGVISGLLVSILRLPSLIVTLCLSYIYRGIVTIATEKTRINAPVAFAQSDNLLVKGCVLLIVVIVLYILFEYTRVGKSIKSIGGNRVVAQQAGINVRKYVIIGFALVGLCVGLGTFFASARQSYLTSGSGSGYEMDVMFAVLIGGLSMEGGARSKIRAAVFGSIIVTVLGNGFVILGIDSMYINAIKGVLFLFCCWLSFEHKKGQIVQ